MIAIFEGVPSIFTSSWKVEVITTDLPTISAIQFFGRPWEIWEMEDFYTSPRITWPDILLLLSIYVNLCLYCVYLLNLYTYLFIGVKHIDIDVDTDCHLLSRAALPRRTNQESSTVNSLSLAGNRLGPDDAQQLCESCCKCEAPLFQRKSNQNVGKRNLEKPENLELCF